MSNSKKYDYLITQDESGWAVEIIRRVTRKKSVISKTQNEFKSEADAIAWGQQEVEDFLKKTNLSEQSKRRAKKSASAK